MHFDASMQMATTFNMLDSFLNDHNMCGPSTLFPTSLLLVLSSMAYFLFGPSRTHMKGNKKGHNVSISQTQLIPSNISHRRMFPTHHRFCYSYLAVGIPVRDPSSNWLVSVDEQRWWHKGIFHVEAENHLWPSAEKLTLSEKLDFYLKTQGLDPAEFPHSHLVTGAQTMFYAYTPVSIWYLYNANYEMKYIIGEVNTPANERRMFLFPASELTKDFSGRSAKDCHVSSFNSRKGSYSMRSSDTVTTGKLGAACTLRSSKDFPKLVARWWSVADAIDITQTPSLSSLWFVARYGWTVPTTYMKILLEGFLLSQYRKLSIYYRPEPKATTVARPIKTSECTIASVFLSYINHITSQASLNCDILIKTGLLTQPQILLESPVSGPDSCSESPKDSMKLRVRTPMFYRQMITYPQLTKFLEYTLLSHWEENHTAECAESARLISALKVAEKTEKGQAVNSTPSFILRLIWALFSMTRPKTSWKGQYPRGLPSARSSCPFASQPAEKHDTFFLDDYVKNHCDWQVQLGYCYAVTRSQLRNTMESMIGEEWIH